MDTKSILTKLRSLHREKDIVGSLAILSETFPGNTVFTTSFGAEDQVISHLIFNTNLNIKVVTIDTGRLFHETYSVFSETIKKYGKTIKVFFPENHDIERMVSNKGPFSFYYSPENRLECCRLRKVLPLNRGLNGVKAWISGIRSDQSENRRKMDFIEYDSDRMLIKYYPLFDWSHNEVWNFIRSNKVPYNILHDRGFASIGCAPCTRAVREGEDFRSGRWWWENGSSKECGLHHK